MARGWPLRHTGVFGGLVLLLALPALGQKAERPEVNVGETWKFVQYYAVPSRTPNRTWVVTAVTPDRIEATENGEPLLLTRELNVLESPRTRSTNPRALSFPMEVGKRWRYESTWVFKPKNSTGTHLGDVEVVGHEKVAVPAGEFEAFRLSARESVHGTSPINSQYGGEITETYWYAPRARAVVKSVRHNPYLGTTTVELVSFPPPATAPAP